jgi:RNA polymerase sigma-70 factor (ECF subfamily)
MQDARVVAIEKIYKENVDKIYRFFYTHTNDQSLSEDLTSKTFMKVVQKFTTFDQQKASAITWLFTIARNTLIDYYRLSSTKNTVSILSLDSESSDSQNDGSNGVDSTESLPVTSHTATNIGNKEADKYVQQDRNRAILNEAMEKLSEEDQLLIFLRYTQELSYEEVAKEINTTVNAVGVRIHRAVEKLKKILEESNDLDRLDKIQ